MGAWPGHAWPLAQAASSGKQWLAVASSGKQWLAVALAAALAGASSSRRSAVRQGIGHRTYVFSVFHETRRAETRHGGLLAPSGGACKKLIALSVNPPLTLSCSTRAVEAQAGHDIRDMTEKGEGGSSLGSLEEILDWKEKGNARLKAADNDAALECYSRGINIGVKAISSFQGLAQDFDPLKKAVSQLLSNRGHVRLAQQLPKLALQDCRQAAEVDFENPKAYWRGVTAALQLEEDQERRDAAELLRQGLRLAWGTGGSALSKLLGENLHLWREWADAGHVPSMYLLALALLKGNQG